MKQQGWLVAGIFLAGTCTAVAFLRPVTAVRADEEKPAARMESWKAEDEIFQEYAGQLRISQDGKWLVWVKSTADKEKDARVSNLFLSSLTDRQEIELTRGSDNNSEPRWSPDGEHVAFVSSRPRAQAKPETSAGQIWLINPHGGEPWVLTELSRAPRQIDWLDKDTIIYSAEEEPGLYEQEMKKKKDDSEVVDDADHAPPVRLYKISVKDKKITRLTNNTDWIESWSVSKDGKYAAASHAKSLHYEFDQKVPPIAVLHNLSNGTEKQIFTEGRVRPFRFEWAADGSGFFAAAPYSTDPKFLTATILKDYFYELASGKATEIPADWENGFSFGIEHAAGGFIADLAAGSHSELARYTAEKTASGWTWHRQPLTGEHVKNIQGFALSEDGKTIVYQHSTASKLPQIYRAQLDGNKIISPVQITKLNEGLVTGRTFAKTEVIRWKGSIDEEVEGILYYPANYEAGKKYPVITAIHGGPTGWDSDAWDDNWAYPVNLMTQRGAFVLRPNYHGSANYGLKWVESICCGKYYDLETPDINMGVDYLISKGMVDPDKVATLGWSNGSILSISLITTYPARYKAASVGAGDVEWISDWGNVDFGDSFDSYYFGKSPMEDPQLYIKKSPFFKMDKVQAPVLIFHGSADRNVPPAQSWSFFRALEYYGKTVKFVVFPGEPHGPQKLTHQVRKVEDEVAWFDKYFFKTAKPENEAFKKDSPLDVALRAKNVGTSTGNYGVAFSSKGKSLLIPEMVKRGDLEIGRFEVTAGQFQDRSPNQLSEPTKPNGNNLPAANVSLADAKAYAAWLSTQTGQTWRLPYEDEVKDLYENRDSENTLDYWAGYAPNPEDAARLREKAKELSGTARLLKEVGSFHGQGKDDEEPIYDLGGNVAEWVLTRDGKGKVMGGSADCPADPKSNCTPAPEYMGFRVVRGAAKPVAAKQ
jgi:dipeptidyl aminopeptidase/acylaminoacyl peptidase/formylglycine-generating enzyme required for sulfatase activity